VPSPKVEGEVPPPSADAEGLYAKAQELLEGKGGVKKDPKTAARLLEDAAMRGHDDARLALAHMRKELSLTEAQFNRVLPRMEKPSPRIELGIALRNIAHAALDLSDGLSGDLSHILDASHVGASINTDTLPISDTLRQQDPQWQLQCALGGGDDYELCFTAPPEKREQVLAAAKQAGIPVTRIGRIAPQPGIRLFNATGPFVHDGICSFDHFTTPRK